MADDFELAVSLVLDGGNTPEAQRAFTEILTKLGIAAEKAARKTGEEQAKAEAGGYARESRTAWRQATEQARRTQQAGARQILNDQKAANEQRINAEKAAFKALNNLLADYTRRRLLAEDDVAKKTRRTHSADSTLRTDAERAAEKIRLQKLRAADSLRLAEVQRANREQLQEQRASDRSINIEEQASAQRRTAIVHAGLRLLTTTYETGFRGIVAVIRAHAEARASTERSSDTRSVEETRTTLSRETTIIRTQLEEQGSVYTRAAQRKLTQIERNSAAETRVITEASVRQAAAQQKAQERTSTGLVGAARGSGGLGGTIQTLAAYAGGGLLLRNIAQITVAEIKLQRQTDAVINSTGGVAGVNAKHVQDYSRELSALSGVSHQAIQNAENILLTFRDIRNTSKGKIFDEATASVLNLSVALKEDLKSASIQVGKALNDPIKGVTALRRVGVQFTQEQTDAIKILAAGGPSLKARELALKSVARASDTLAKAQHRLSDLELIDGSKKKLSVSALVTLRNAQEAVTKARQADTDASKFQLAAGSGLTGKIGAQNIILAELNKEFAGSAAAQSTAGDRFRQTLHNIEEEIGLFFYPTIQRVLGGLATLLNNLFHGQGDWKIIRDGLTGIAIGLGAILAVKAGVEVLGLISTGIELIAASPTALAVGSIALLSGATYALAKNNKGVKDFFTSLVVGTKNWVEVGYKIDKPVKSLSTAVYLQTLAGSAARHTKDFFSSLVTGTKNWAEVGYKIDGPVKSLSNIVLLQTSLGAAGRTIVDSLGNIAGGIKALFRGDLVGVVDEFRIIRGRLAKVLDPLGGEILKGLSETKRKVVDFLKGLFTGSGTSVETLFGFGHIDTTSASRTLGLKLRSIVGGAFATARHDVSEFFGGIFNGSAGAGSGDGVARIIGDTLRGGVARGFRDARTAVVGFARGLFTDIKLPDPVELLAGIKANDGGAAGRLGTRLRDLIKSGIKKIGPVLSTVGDFLGHVGSDVGKFFTKSVLPALAEIPYILGKFLSRTAFSKQFLTILRGVVVAVGSIAATIAIQFVLGFVKGLEQRRGDIARVLYSTLRAAVVLAVKAGPFGIIGLALASAFIGGKVIGAIGTMRKLFGVAAAGLTGDLKTTQTAARDLRLEAGKIRGPGAGVGNTFLSIGRSIDTARGAAGKLGGALLGFDGHLRTIGTRLQGLDVGERFNSAGAKIDATTGQYVASTRRRFDALQTYLGNGFVHAADGLRSANLRVGGFFADGLAKAKGFVSSFSTTTTSGLVKGSDEFKRVTANNTAAVEKRMRAAQGAGAAAASAIGGYFAAMSDDTTTKVIGIGTTVASTLAIAAVDPVAGAVSAVAGIVGFVVGNAQKKSAELRAAAKSDAEAVKSETETITASLKSAFENSDFRSASGRAQAEISAIQDRVKAGDQGSRDFFTKFKGNIAAVSVAAGKGAGPLKRYTDALASRALNATLDGNKQAVHDFNKELLNGINTAYDFAHSLDFGTRGQKVASLKIIDQAFGRLDAGGGIAQFRKDLKGIGSDGGNGQKIIDKLVNTVKTGIGRTAGGEFLRGLSPAFAQAQLDQAQLAANEDRLKTPAEHYSEAWDGVRASIDKATTAYKDHLTALEGGKQTLDQATIATIDAATSVQQTHGHQGDDARRREIIRGLQANLSDQLKTLADQSGGNLKVYQDKVKYLSAYLVGQLSGPNGAFPKNRQAAQDFINTVLKTPTSAEFKILSNADEVKSQVKALRAEADKLDGKKITMFYALDPTVPIPTDAQVGKPWGAGSGLKPYKPTVAPPSAGHRSLMVGPGHHAVPVNRPPATPLLGPGPGAVPANHTTWNIDIDASGHPQPEATAHTVVRKLRSEEFLKTGGGITT